jgi:Alginate export
MPARSHAARSSVRLQMRRVSLGGCTAILVLLAGLGVDAHADGWRDSVALLASDRVRGEAVDWFRPPPGAAPAGAQRYAFVANQLRLGVRLTLPHLQFVLEGQDTEILNPPDDASLGPPFGALGPGALYFASTRERDQGEPFLKQAFLTLRRSGFAVTGGRFDSCDGLETVPADPSLAFLKRQRIAERLLGPFNFTHVTRSFDGARLAYDAPAWNATALLAHPTVGAFEVSANRELDHVSVAGLALTWKGLPAMPPIDARLFYIYYEDDRRDTTKVDNRPAAVRATDHATIAINTWGGHVVTVAQLGPGRVDGLVWLALQSGSWGEQNHGAWASAVEVGYQLPRILAAPWLRLGYDRSSGDGDPNDGAHHTFFQILPTPRIYAQLPFYNLMNSADAFAQVLLQPHAKVSVRLDYHWLRLSESADLWYSGGGAFKNDVFGYAGTPSSGRSDLAHLVDASVTVLLSSQVTLGLYYGHAFGQGVVRGTFAGADANYGFGELIYRY